MIVILLSLKFDRNNTLRDLFETKIGPLQTNLVLGPKLILQILPPYYKEQIKSCKSSDPDKNMKIEPELKEEVAALYISHLFNSILSAF